MRLLQPDVPVTERLDSFHSVPTSIVGTRPYQEFRDDTGDLEFRRSGTHRTSDRFERPLCPSVFRLVSLSDRFFT